ncbi:dynein light intermediate chain, putative [Schistosoma mansoni]|uniref:dynein light intermediate chain, putative n=1 Tax=Schistosoma mansoni TaxID=6183 RepID=UPI0001A64153|nr:dynein light intermediate chain, putative [Schistosoma mansoni]|eukprot:XP_018646398.1 dynein light intermediate chain, putative [Schistosoma mansoni]
MYETTSNGEAETKKYLWSSLLDEVTNKAKIGLSDSKNLVVFGDDLSGKSTLICRLQGNEDKQEGFGLEYDIIEVKDEVKDVSANLSVFIIDGNPIQSHLLKFVITEDSFNDQMALMVVSINEPWKIIEALEKWAEILNKHINKLKLSKEMITACKSRINSASYSTMYATSQETTSRSSFLNDNESFIEEMYEDNVLNNNLGVPLIVVVTKTDLMKVMIKENQYSEEHFDFIQMHIRRFCLSYGAALFYVSVKEDKNCDLLNRYIQHRIYGFPFSQSAYIVEGDCVFIPAGWDNHKKINVLGENLTKINAQHPFSTVIPRPVPRKAIHREPEIMTIDEQAFLLRLSTIKENENIDPNTLKEFLGSGGLHSNSKQPANSLKIGSGAKTMDDNDRLPVSPTPIFRAKISPVGPINNLTSTPSIQGTSDGVLADFFSNLLKKRPVVNNTTGETSTEPQLQRTSQSSGYYMISGIEKNWSSD